MKNIFKIIAVSFFAIGMIACDKIEEPYFQLNNEVSEHVLLSAEDTLNWIDEKVVLLEDYTGVRCINCPDAAVVAHQLQEQYGHQLVVLSVHAGGMSNPQPGNFPDFLTDEGTEWFNSFNIGTNPNATINRQKRGDVYKYGVDEWAGAVATAIEGKSNIRLLTALEYDDATRELKVSAYSKFLEEFPDMYNLTVCIMEDSIVGKQIGQSDDYVHRHVFRETMNGAWGKDLNNEPIVPNTEIVKSYSITLNEAFNVDNCYVIAYIYRVDTKEILQVTEKKIK